MKYLRSVVGACASSLITIGAYNIYTDNKTFYKNLIIPLFHKIDPELAHKLTIFILKYAYIPVQKNNGEPSLEVELQHLKFNNPVGIAAGFDKNGEVVEALDKFGFGFIEIGSVTPNPQPGNAKPRIFRLSEDEAIINRYGFNSDGHDAVYQRLKTVKLNSLSKQFILGINLGKNKSSVDAVSDYCSGITKFSDIADYYVINVSSPNTAGLRDLQRKDLLKSLLSSVVKTRNNLSVRPLPLIFLKLSPDLNNEERKDIAEIINCSDCRVDGLIISNTTVTRNPELQSIYRNETGGLSGKPLRELSTQMISEMYKLTKGTIPIIGVGGISSSEDAYEKIKAGASLIQIYTSFVYHGPPLVKEIKLNLYKHLRNDNFSTVSEAVGSSLKNCSINK